MEITAILGTGNQKFEYIKLVRIVGKLPLVFAFWGESLMRVIGFSASLKFNFNWLNFLSLPDLYLSPSKLIKSSYIYYSPFHCNITCILLPYILYLPSFPLYFHETPIQVAGLYTNCLLHRYKHIRKAADGSKHGRFVYLSKLRGSNRGSDCGNDTRLITYKSTYQ